MRPPASPLGRLAPKPPDQIAFAVSIDLRLQIIHQAVGCLLARYLENRLHIQAVGLNVQFFEPGLKVHLFISFNREEDDMLLTHDDPTGSLQYAAAITNQEALAAGHFRGENPAGLQMSQHLFQKIMRRLDVFDHPPRP